MARTERLLSEIRASGSFLSLYTEGMSLLVQSGLFEFLKALATPRLVKAGSDIQSLASHGAFMAGYAQCLEDILEFRETFLAAKQIPLNAPMDFGALSLAVQKGDLTQKEADDIRAGNIRAKPDSK